jgi:hypothetical protein
MIERLLKGYVLEHRKDHQLAALRIPAKNILGKHKGKNLAALSSLSDGQFVEEVLCRMSLGDVEQMLKVPEKQGVATDRNDTMHSNLYLSAEATLPRPERIAKNRRRLKRALNHLQRVFRRYTGLKLVKQDNGRLVVRPNSTVQRAGARVARSGR